MPVLSTEQRDAFLNDAKALLGTRGLTQDVDLMEPWLTDWRGRFTGKALALASPASTQECADLVKLCARYGVPIVPQGGNSGMSGGATPDTSGNALLLSLRRMNTIHPIDTESRQVICDAGVILQNLHEAAEDKGLRFPLTLGGKGSATIGGLVSTNAGGTQVLRHGGMGAQVLGLEAVLADGSVFDALTVLKKDNRGFDLKQMLIGSEGTLGIVTRVNLCLAPALAGRKVLWAGMETIQQARALLMRAEAIAGPALEGFEVIPAHSLDAVLAHLPDGRSPLQARHGWHALIELVGDATTAPALDDLAERLLMDAYEAGLVQDATIAANERQAEDFWLLRESISSAEKETGPALQHDISVPVEKMADFIAETGPVIEARFPGTTTVAFGHLGDGNVHYHVRAPEGAVRGEWENGPGKAISRFVYDLVTQWGGSISAEHGIGQLKRDELGRLGNPVALTMMRAVKQALDPQGILNPGKLVPLAPDPDTP